jgi:peroxiredoxin
VLTEYVVWSLRFATAAVFAFAAVGKFAEPDSVRQSLAEFGVPARFTAPGSRALPALELAVAVLVLPPSTAVAGTVAALVLLAVFTAAVLVQLRRGRRPRCSCFGASAPVSGWTPVRNAGFAGLAAGALAGSLLDPGLPGTLPAGPGLGLTAGLLLAAVQLRQAVRLRALGVEVKRLRDNQPRTGGLLAGTPAPEFALPDVDGRTRTLAGLRAAGQPLVLVFVHPDCPVCTMFAMEFPYWHARSAGRLTLVPIGGGDPDENRAWAEKFDVTGLLVQHRAEVAARYKLLTTPAAIHLDTRGRVTGPPARTLPEIRDLLTTTLEATPAVTTAPAPA